MPDTRCRMQNAGIEGDEIQNRRGESGEKENAGKRRIGGAIHAKSIAQHFSLALVAAFCVRR